MEGYRQSVKQKTLALMLVQHAYTQLLLLLAKAEEETKMQKIWVS